jgi:membrane protease YdiL (CAAX protease family)
MGQAYLDLTFRGRPGGWRYGLGLLLIVIITQVLGGALALAVMGRSVGELVDVLRTGQAPHGLSSRLFLAMNLPSIAFLLAAWLVVVTVHRRGLLTLITPRSRLSLRRLLQGFGVWFALQALSLVVLYALDPSGVQLHLDLPRLLPFAALALVLTPLQTSGEELVFRGYLLQALGGLIRRPWLLAGINGVLFMLPHLVNPEMSYGAVPMALSYFTIGMFLAVITLRDNRLELALGAHAANNLFDGVFAHTAVSTLPTPSLFTVAQAFPWPSLAVMVACCAVFYAVVFRRPRLASSPSRNLARGGEHGEHHWRVASAGDRGRVRHGTQAEIRSHRAQRHRHRRRPRHRPGLRRGPGRVRRQPAPRRRARRPAAGDRRRPGAALRRGDGRRGL